MTPSRWRTWAACAGTVLVVGLCLWPKDYLPRREEPPELVPELDKAVHFGMFAVYGGLWMRARTGTVGRGVWAGRVIAAGLLLAIGTELAQGLPRIHRDPDPLDGLADVVGMAAAVGLFLGWGARGSGVPNRGERP